MMYATTYNEHEVRALWESVLHAKFFKCSGKDISAFLVLQSLLLEKTIGSRFLKTCCNSLLHRGIRAKDNASGRSQSRANQGKGTDKPSNTPPRGSKRL
jgi:hypothetical protein